MIDNLTDTNIQPELAVKRDRLAAVQADEADAVQRHNICQDRLKTLAKTRTWMNEMRGALTAKRLALGTKWTAAFNDGGRDLAVGADELHQIVQQENLIAVTYRQHVEVEEPAGRIAALTANLAVMSARADIAQLNADIHYLEVLQASEALGRLEGRATISGERSEQLGKLAYAATQDRERAALALEAERRIQESVRTKSTGAVTWSNPA